MGCYLAPDDTLTIERVVEVLKELTKGSKLLVVGDMNANLADPEQDGRMWSMIREGREVRSWMDYILGTDHRLFENVSVWDPRNNSDHYLVLGCLHSDSLKEHMQYLRGRKKPPLRPPTEPTREDKIFAALRKAVPKPRCRRPGKTNGSRRQRGDSLTRESPRAGIQRNTRRS